jgi:hypothetical protein
MAVINHGKWVRYPRPNDTPDSISSAVAFMRREGDGKDWYVHVYGRKVGDPLNPSPKVDPETLKPLAQQPPKPKGAFQKDSIKGAAMLHKHLGVYVVGAATRDETAINPTNQFVFEVTGWSGSDPQAEFGGRVYDPAKGTFGDRPPPTKPPPSPEVEALTAALGEALKRIEALEGRR